ncbi:SCP2 sterol-binding domain-containing protein [Kibdelosporangium philippinense]|uniref:SCP2 sterol-binding domain-containing protein n=1 Tax=Kibdelosporangium philippinense TaxID=211113 RepID=A0ABS8Z5T3_9PSEU|nr:SCP2 sterol-binding domain-containing protein [Kibdelosporangium philippinense]MCE7003239.1 SCP2 sterol-binding domain-containing protein [Kibdelosporangium philippinense]
MTAVKFLSEEYLDGLGGLGPADQVSIPHVHGRFQFHADDVDYFLRVEGGAVVEAGRGQIPDSDLEIRATYQDLLAFESGELHAATAFVTGQFAVTGDRAKVLDLMVVLQSGNYHQFISELWARTTW